MQESRVQTSGKILVEPNPVPAESQTPVRLRWETDAAKAEMYVCEDGNAEKLLANVPRGETFADWIQAGITYLFRLYDTSGPAVLLDEVIVTREIGGSLSVESKSDLATILRWTITPPATAEIYLIEDDLPGRLVTSGPSGSFTVEGLAPGIPYRFRLYPKTEGRPLLDEVKVFREIAGKLSVTPNPMRPGDCPSTLLAWEITPPATGEICIAEEGDREKLVCRGPSGTFELEGLGAGIEYHVQLYATAAERSLLDEVKVFRKIAGKLSVTPYPTRPGESPGTLLAWEITPPATGEICIAEEGDREKLVCRGPSGTFELEGLGAGIEYHVRLYADAAKRRLLDEARVFHKIAGTISATPNPIALEAGFSTLLEWKVTPPALAEISIAAEGEEEALVCRGASGSFKLKDLRPTTNYVVSLYSYPQPRELLDQVRLRFAPIPWQSLLTHLRSGNNERFFGQLADFIASAMPVCLHRKEFGEWFRLWESQGFHVTPVHFYEPIPDSQTLSPKLWRGPGELAGVNLNRQSQEHLLFEVFPTYRGEYDQIPLEPSGDDGAFYLRNGRFEGLDALISYCMIRHFKPARIIEVGSGYSTLVLAQAARKNGNTKLHSIEPYPENFLTRGFPGLTSLLVRKVEEVDLSFFDQLVIGDCLFIDTSHVVKTGGDLNFLFLEVLPRIHPGVFVHVHDIFLPREYPKEWIMKRRRFWTEQYLLQAFLAFNSEFEVLVGSACLKENFPEELKTIFPQSDPWQGGSFWMRRKFSGPVKR